MTARGKHDRRSQRSSRPIIEATLPRPPLPAAGDLLEHQIISTAHTACSMTFTMSLTAAAASLTVGGTCPGSRTVT